MGRKMWRGRVVLLVAVIAVVACVAVVSADQQKPSITAVNITPDPAFWTSTLTAVPEGWFDAQGDPEGYVFQWQRWDGHQFDDIEGATNATLGPGNFTRGDQIQVACQPFDGTFLGNVQYDTITISDAPPLCTITSPENGAVVLHNPVMVQGTAEDDGDVVTVRIRMNGGTWLNVDGTTSWSRALYPPLGESTFEARAMDEVGHWGPIASITITRELDPPTTNIITPLDGATTMGFNVQVVGDAHDNTAVAVVRVRVNGSAWVNANLEEPEEGDYHWWRYLPLAFGANLIEARAMDENGLWGAMDSITVTRISNLPPTVVITSPANGYTTADSGLYVSGTANDDHAVSVVRIRINGGVWLNATGTTSWTRWAPLSVGANVIEARARDNEGVWGPIVQITVNRTAP